MMEITNKDKEMLIGLIKNEIESDLDYLNDLKGDEFNVWASYVLELRELLIKIKPMVII